MLASVRVAFSYAAAALAFGYGVLALILLPQVQPSARADLGLTRDAFGWIHGATFLAAAVGGVVFGRLSDLGRRRLATGLSIALPAAGLLLASRAEGGLSLALARVVSGFGAGGAFGVAHTSAALLAKPSARGFAAGFVQAAAPLGAVAAVLVSGGIDAGLFWRDVLALAAAPGAIGLLVPFAADRRLDAKPERKATFREALRAARDVRFRFVFLALALHMAAYWMFFVPIPEWLEADRGFDRAFVRGYQLRLGVGFVFGDLLFAAAARRFGAARSFVVASFLFGIGIAASPLLPETATRAPAFFTAILVATGLSGGLWSAFAPFFSNVVDEDRRALVSSTSYQLARASQFALQPLVPALRDLGSGYDLVFALAGLAAAFGGLAVVGAFARAPRATNEGPRDLLPTRAVEGAVDRARDGAKRG
jgi:MFS family permease